MAGSKMERGWAGERIRGWAARVEYDEEENSHFLHMVQKV